jgi:hypothetical protein
MHTTRYVYLTQYDLQGALYTLHYKMIWNKNTSSKIWSRPLQATAQGLDAAHHTILSGPRSLKKFEYFKFHSVKLYMFWKLLKFSIVGSEKQVGDWFNSHHHRLLPPVFPITSTLKYSKLSIGQYNLYKLCQEAKHEPD